VGILVVLFHMILKFFVGDKISLKKKKINQFILIIVISVGQLGCGEISNIKTTPIALKMDEFSSNTKITQISNGYYFSCSITNENEVICWGDNSFIFYFSYFI
jgi:alpha-tubulin suppressor-like RCC1 family protein